MPATLAKSRGLISLTMSSTLQFAKTASSENNCKLLKAQKTALMHNEIMDEKFPNPPNYLRQWRDFRHLTQEQLAEAVNTTGSVIHLLETSARGLSHKWLVKLAPVLRTTPGFILDHNPNEMSSDLFEIWNRGDEEDRRKLVIVAETIIPYRAEPGLK
jgi:transcriptional regulator with XRE-family HTH domain